MWFCSFLFQAEDGIRDLVRSRGLGDVYKRQVMRYSEEEQTLSTKFFQLNKYSNRKFFTNERGDCCLLYTSDAADERSSVDLGGRRIIKKKQNIDNGVNPTLSTKVNKLNKAVKYRRTIVEKKMIRTNT